MATGDKNSLKSLCDILFIKKRYEEAIPILKDITNQDYSPVRGYANYRLSQCYRDGLGVKPNTRKARKYFKEAIQLNNGEALYILSTEKFAEGKPQEGIDLLRKAYWGSKRAAYALGYRLYHGEDIEQDQVEGVKLMKRAASKNNRQAMYFLANLTYQNQAEAPTLNTAIEYARRASITGNSKAAELLEKLEQQRKDESAPLEESTRARTS